MRFGLLALFCIALGSCTDPSDLDGDGFTEEDGDCNDNAAEMYPGAPEVPADRMDENCNGFADEDLDGDGYSVDGSIGGAEDCNDTSALISPSGMELLDDIDQDCDGVIDNHTHTYDDDGDGASEADGDCNDDRDDVHPSAPEVDDGFDNDCDNSVDEGTGIFDDDEDGFSELEGDCDDANPSIYPEASEVGPGTYFGDDLDNDCDGVTDEGTWSFDDDADGFSEDGTVGGMVDCDDSAAVVSPSAFDVPADGIDNNCDGIFA
jgi:hypothetical protein